MISNSKLLTVVDARPAMSNFYLHLTLKVQPEEAKVSKEQLDAVFSLVLPILCNPIEEKPNGYPESVRVSWEELKVDKVSCTFHTKSIFQEAGVVGATVKAFSGKKFLAKLRAISENIVIQFGVTKLVGKVNNIGGGGGAPKRFRVKPLTPAKQKVEEVKPAEEDEDDEEDHDFDDNDEGDGDDDGDDEKDESSDAPEPPKKKKKQTKKEGK